MGSTYGYAKKHEESEKTMHPHKWILNILPWQINFELDVLHPTIIDFTQGSATWARDGGQGFETPCTCSKNLRKYSWNFLLKQNRKKNT